MNKDKLRLSSSSVGTYLTCPAKYNWVYNEMLKPKGDYSIALTTGVIVHRLLHWMNTGMETTDRITSLYTDLKKEFPQIPDDELKDSIHQSLTLVQGYLKKYESDPIEIVSSETHMELDCGDYVLYGRVDGLARTQDKRLWRHEIKTAGRMDRNYLAGLTNSLQSGIYHWMLDELREDEKIYGTIYSILVKTKVPQFERSPVLTPKKLIELTKRTVNRVYERICEKDFEPSLNCFTYFRECPYSMLCFKYSDRIRKEFFEHRPPTKPKADD